MEDEKQIKARKLAELNERREKVKAMGGEKRVAAQLKKNKLTARDRIEKLLDEGTFHEVGAFVGSRNTGAYAAVPAEGVVTGYGKVNGRKVCVYAQDFTSMGGTMSQMQAKKICDLMDFALKVGCPMIALNDTGGARIQDGVDSLSGYGQIFRRNVDASGVIPQICAILGPTAGGGVYSPALMDFIFMVKGVSYAFITGPRVVKATTGQDIDEEALGGATNTQKKSGVACRSENSEEECFENIKELLSYLPSNNTEQPPIVKCDDQPNRVDPELFDIIPTNPARPYDMKKIISRVFDQRTDGKKNYFELFPLFANNIITCLTRLNGRTVGVVANQPMSKAGCLDIDACDKGSRFIRFCNAFNIPMVTFVDVPGYLPGTDQEWGGIIRHGAKMLYAYSEANVPMITVTVRKAYGGSFIAMGSRDLGVDAVYCWPTTELAVMGAEGAAPIIYRKELEESDNPAETLKEKIAQYREEFANPYKAAQFAHVADVIDPAETRVKIIETMEQIITKKEQKPAKKHGIIPS